MLKTPRRAVLQVHLRRHQAQKQQQQKKSLPENRTGARKKKVQHPLSDNKGGTVDVLFKGQVPSIISKYNI